MASTQILRFNDCELDRGLFQLRRGGHVVRLERIPLELLFLLAGRRGEVVSREEILKRIWGESVFIDTNSAINTAIRKARRALQDNADTPKYLLAVPGRGYRFVARIREPGEPREGLSPLVGRVREMALLRESLAKAVAGHEGLVMISGEAGVGKSRLIEEVIAEARGNRMDVLIGHCVDPEESAPYLPFVEVLDLCVERAATSDDLRRVLGEEGPELARLVPRISRILPDLAIQVAGSAGAGGAAPPVQKLPRLSCTAGRKETDPSRPRGPALGRRVDLRAAAPSHSADVGCAAAGRCDLS